MVLVLCRPRCVVHIPPVGALAAGKRWRRAQTIMDMVEVRQGHSLAQAGGVETIHRMLPPALPLPQAAAAGVGAVVTTHQQVRWRKPLFTQAAAGLAVEGETETVQAVRHLPPRIQAAAVLQWTQVTGRRQLQPAMGAAVQE